MSSQKVVLEKHADGTYTEIGLLVRSSRNMRTIQGFDGVEFERRGSDVAQPLAGSFLHLLRAHPTVLLGLMETDLSAVAKQLVADSQDGLTWSDLRSKLEEVPEAPDIQRQWGGVKSSLRNDAETSVGSKPERVRLINGATHSLLPLVPPGVSMLADQLRAAQVDSADAAPSTAAPAELEVQGREDVQGAADGAPSTKAAEAGGPVSMPEPSAASTTSLLERLAEAGVDPAHRRDLGVVRRNLISIGVGMSARQRRLLASAELADKTQRALVDVIRVAGGERVPPHADEDTDLVLEALSVEVVSQAQQLRTPEAERAALAVVESVVRISGSAFQPHLAVALLRSTARWQRSLSPEVIDQLLDVMAAAWTTDRGIAGDDDLRAVADVLRRGQRTSRGAVRLVTALAESAPDLVADELWWPIEFRALAELAAGPLGRVLEMKPIDSRIAAARVSRQITTAETRPAIFLAAAAPSSLARHVDPEQLQAAWRRAAKIDPLAAEWLRHLSDASTAEKLRSAIDTARSEADDANARAVRAQEALAESEQRAETLARQLAAAVESSDSATQSQLEQAQRETLRSLARLAVAADAAALSHGDQPLRQKIQFLAGREGLEASEVAGSTSTFDPARHDSNGVRIEHGASVTVSQAGYDYVTTTGDRFVLIKPQVVAT